MKLIGLLGILLFCACGVKKAPTPLYTLPHQAESPSPVASPMPAGTPQ